MIALQIGSFVRFEERDYQVVSISERGFVMLEWKGKYEEDGYTWDSVKAIEAHITEIEYSNDSWIYVAPKSEALNDGTD